MLIKHLFEDGQQRIKHLTQRADLAWLRLNETWQQRLTAAARLLHGLSFKTTLERGFTLLLDETRQPIKRRQNVVLDRPMHLQFFDGEMAIAVECKGSPLGKSLKKPSLKNDDQGSLF